MTSAKHLAHPTNTSLCFGIVILNEVLSQDKLLIWGHSSDGKKDKQLTAPFLNHFLYEYVPEPEGTAQGKVLGAWLTGATELGH